jgi:hypothetical protein
MAIEARNFQKFEEGLTQRQLGIMADCGLLPCVRSEAPENVGKRKKSTVRFTMGDVIKFINDHRGA